MASYVVLARKWRPAQFPDIVGQGPVVRTLMNAIRSNRIHQAYLFTGSRGIGKTSIARIFAKVVRCEATIWENNWLRSCDECSSCKEITQGNSVDVIEIDGASNNGVDHVREIRENAKYLPSTGNRKIYIIDEVHMLSTQAFNALLKTLEEPPAHVIFIFATTEPHKIPATILSRCQRFDLRRVTVAQIQTRLTEVTQAEGLQAEPGALALVARAAEGGMRDALSLLDQVIAFSGNTITVQSVRDSIGLIEGQTLLGILGGVLGRKPLEALALVEQAYQQGHDLRVMTRSLVEFLHGAILAKVGAPASATLELSETEWKELKAISELRSLEELELIFQVLNHGVELIVRSPQPKVVLDVLLVKCATAEALIAAEDTGNLSGNPATGGAAGGVGLAGGRGARASAQTAASPVSDGALDTSFAQASAGPALETAPRLSPAAAIANALAASAAPAASKPSAPKPLNPSSASAQMGPAPATKSISGATSGVAGVVAAPKAPQGPALNPTWEGLIDRVRQTRPLLATVLEHGNCSKLPTEADPSMVIQFHTDNTYYKEQLATRIYNDQLVAISKEYFGRHPQIRLDLTATGESIAARRARELRERERSAKEAAQNHPIIREAQSLFGGELGPIEILGADDARAL